MSTHNNALDLAKQGNPQAIAYLINQQLKSKGITAQAKRLGSTLEIELEALDAVPQSTVFPIIDNGIRKLEIVGLESLMVSCRITGSTDLQWQEQSIFDLEIADFEEEAELSPPPLSLSNPVSASSQPSSLVSQSQSMQSIKGKVLDFSIQSNSGLISGNDGKRYRFIGASWKLDRPPSQGIAVEFEIDSNNRAVEIYPDLEARNVITSTLSRTFSSSENRIANDEPVDQTKAIIYFLLCMPLGFAQWGQGSKGWLWVLVSILTGGFGGIAAMVDYWMCFVAQQKRSLGEWDIFPQ